MRISADPTDPGYANFHKGPSLLVYLDGVELRDVVTADDVENLVVQYKRDEQGNFVIDHAAGEVVRKTRRGFVFFGLKP